MKIKKIARKKNKLNSYLINITILLILSFFLFNIKVYGNEKITISNFSYSRAIGYLEGNFFSFSENKNITKAIGMYFALSESGQNTSLSYCQDFIMTCDKNLVKIRTKMLCERISNEKCRVIFNEDKFLVNKKKINIKNIQEFKKYFIIIEDKKNIKKNNHQEIRIPNFSETSDGSKWNM